MKEKKIIKGKQGNPSARTDLTVEEVIRQVLVDEYDLVVRRSLELTDRIEKGRGK